MCDFPHFILFVVVVGPSFVYNKKHLKGFQENTLNHYIDMQFLLGLQVLLQVLKLYKKVYTFF